MKRRAFGVVAAATVTMLPLAAAGASWPIQGRHYARIGQRPAQAIGDAVEVLEFFTYGCRACEVMAPLLAQWQARLPAPVNLRRMPVARWDDFVILQNLYFAIESLGLVRELHPKVFEAVRHRKRLETEEQIGQFVAGHGVDRSRFIAVLNSNEVAEKSLEARRLAESFQVLRTPTFIVGREWVTDIVRAGSVGRAMEVLDVLRRLRR